MAVVCEEQSNELHACCISGLARSTRTHVPCTRSEDANARSSLAPDLKPCSRLRHSRRRRRNLNTADDQRSTRISTTTQSPFASPSSDSFFSSRRQPGLSPLLPSPSTPRHEQEAIQVTSQQRPGWRWFRGLWNRRLCFDTVICSVIHPGAAGLLLDQRCESGPSLQESDQERQHDQSKGT